LLDAEADRLCEARRYERIEVRKVTRAGSYQRQLHTKAGQVNLKVYRNCGACRSTRHELIVIDAMTFVAMPETAAELLFQIISGRAERAAVIVATNLRFSEWIGMFPNARLSKAMLDRLTDQAHIIETGTESYRFRRTLKKKGSK
jgi:IstB-like ATP binding protein/Transposase, Mutator family